MNSKLLFFIVSVCVLLFAGSLSAQTWSLSIAVSDSSPVSVDLTAEGQIDWVSWARSTDDVALRDRKSGVDSLIFITAIDTALDPDGFEIEEPFSYGPEGHPFTWSDGTPTQSPDAAQGGIWMPSPGNGFQITVPSSTSPQVLKVYTGVWYATVRMVAHLSDFGAEDAMWEDSFTEADDANARETVINFQSGVPGQTLTVEWLVIENLDQVYEGWGNVTFRAVALSSGTTDIEESQGSILKDYELDQNYPNPFNPSTNIRFTLQKNEDVNLIVYDISGKVVNTLVNDKLSLGQHTVTWNGMDHNGQLVPSGVYLYQIRTATYTETRKMMLLK
jgi:hypothetical protein